MSRSSALSFLAPLLGLALSATTPGCARPAPTGDCNACPSFVAPAPADCPAPTPTASPATPPALTPAAAPSAGTTAAPVTASALSEPALPDEPPEEASPLSLLFQPVLNPLTIEEVSRDKHYRRVDLSLSSFVVRGRSPAIKALNDEVRRAERPNDWAEHAKGRDGDIEVQCVHGIATRELFSFGCEILDGTLTIADLEAATGGVAARPTGSGYTFAIVDDRLIPIALRDLLRPDADLVARIRELAAEDEGLDSREPDLWKDDDCISGALVDETQWMLGTDALTLWGNPAEECPSLALAYDDIEPLLIPGGVVARYFASRRAAEAAAEAAAERAAEAAAAEAATAAPGEQPTATPPGSPTLP